jgi:two-component system, cell cycle sensor histidine kinase and response regulator CckA
LNVNSIITGLERMLRRILGEEIDLQVRLAPQLPLVDAGQSMIEQILMNLAVMARNAMPSGGDLVIATEALEVELDPETRCSRRGPGRSVRVRVRDTGSAIARTPAVRASTNETDAGPGLGLAAVRAIVEQLHGWIEVETEPTGGTTFNIFLPAFSDHADSTPALRGGSESILLVAHDQGLRRFICLLLQRLGYAVREAATGLDAIKVWNETNGEFDLLLMDLGMPARLGGWDLLRQLREKNAQLRAVAICGQNPNTSEETSTREEHTSILAKPFTPEALAQAVRDCLDAAYP